MSEQQWHMAKHGHQIGSMSEAEVVSNIQNGSADGKTLLFTAGMSNWTPLADVPQLATHLSGGQTTVPPVLPWRTAHQIDFTIEGSEMQYVEVELDPGETLRVDTGCLVALQPSVTYDIQFVGGVKTALFGGEGLFFAHLAGPGRVWLQSLPLSRLADRIYKAAPQTGGRRKGEGSILDHAFGLGNLIDGK